MKKIWGDFDQWLSHGSGWILETVENLYLNSATYEPIYGRSYIPTPKGIAAKKAVVNVQNKTISVSNGQFALPCTHLLKILCHA